MIAPALALAAATGVGIVLMAVGLRRRTVDPNSADAVDLSVRGRVAMRRAARRVERDLLRKQSLGQDAAMMGRTLEVHALAKMGGLVAGALLVVLAGLLFPAALGLSVPPLAIVILAGVAGLAGWWLPDSMLKTEADKERERFKQSSEAWLELVAQLVTAGSDAHAALHTAARASNQPAFEIIGEALAESSARAEPPWTGLRRLSETRRLDFLEPFVAALELAGTTGAGARQAIVSQVEAARSKTLAEADAVAASASEKMGAPLALIGGAFMVLMGYPPLAGILNSDVVPAGL